jgi:hypothetical protein
MKKSISREEGGAKVEEVFQASCCFSNKNKRNRNMTATLINNLIMA